MSSIYFNQRFKLPSLPINQLYHQTSNPPNSFKMKFFAVIAIAFAATATACKDDNIFCAPGMAPPGKRSLGFTSLARAVVNDKPAEVKVDTE
ncbi:hypothetical protein N0V90_012380 [Kalmusia sp. IMI 367209]|nr:hypothetical protein N0V90_012380 [Kalmusia sp. IMI 367209]